MAARTYIGWTASAESLTSTTAATPQTKTSVTVASPPANKDILWLYNIRIGSGDNAPALARFYDGSVERSSWSPISEDTTDQSGYAGVWRWQTGATPPSSTFSLQYWAETAGQSKDAHYANIVGLQLESGDQYSEGSGGSTTSASYQTGLTLSFDPGQSGDYLIIVSAEIGGGTTSGVPLYWQVTIDGAAQDEVRRRTRQVTSYWPVWFVKRATLAAGTRSIDLKYHSDGTASTTIRNCRIAALKLTNFDAAYYAASDTDASTTSTTFQDHATLTQTPAAGDHLLIFSAIDGSNSGAFSHRARYIEDATVLFETIVEDGLGTGLETKSLPPGYVTMRTLAASSTTWKTQYAIEASATAYMSWSSISVLQLFSSAATVNVAPVVTSSVTLTKVHPTLQVRGVGSHTLGNNVNITPALFEVPTAGDLLICVIAWAAATTAGTISLPAPWVQQSRSAQNLLILEVWYKVAEGGESFGPLITISGGTANDIIDAVHVALRGPTGSTWSWGTNGAAYSAVSGAAIGPIAVATGAVEDEGVVIFAGMKGSGDATDIPVLSGDGLAWTEVADIRTTTGDDMTFGASLGRWSGGVPTLTDKTITPTGGTATVRQGLSVLVNLVPASVSTPQAVAAVAGSVVTSVKSAGKLVAVTSASTLAALKAISKALAPIAASLVSAVKQTVKSAQAAPTAAASLVKVANKVALATVVSAPTVAAALGFVRELLATVTSTVVATTLRGLVMGIAATVASTTSTVKSAAKALAATSASTLAAIKQASKSAAPTVASTVSFAAIRSVLVALVATAATTVSALKLTAKATTLATVTASVTAETLRGLVKSIALTSGSVATALKSVAKAASSTVANTASVLRQVSKIAAATVSSAITVASAKSVLVTLLAIATQNVTALKSASKAFALTVASVTSKTLTVAKTAAAVAATTVATAKAAALRYAITSATTVTAQAVKSVLIALAVLAASTTSALKSVGKPIVAAVSHSAGFVNAIAKRITYTALASVSMMREVTKRAAITALSSVIVSTSKAFVRAVLATASSTVTIASGIGKVVAVTAGVAVSLVKDITHHISVVAGGTVSAIKTIGLLIQAVAAVFVAAVALIPFQVAVSVTVFSVVAAVKGVGKRAVVIVQSITSLVTGITRVASDIFTAAFAAILAARLGGAFDVAFDVILTSTFGREALYRSGGLGAGTPVMVLPIMRGDEGGYGTYTRASDTLHDALGDAGRAMANFGRQFRVRRDDFEDPGPKTGDTLQVDGRVWRIRNATQMSPLSTIWTLDCAAAS